MMEVPRHEVYLALEERQWHEKGQSVDQGSQWSIVCRKSAMVE
jgi:hypothetical protein